MLDKRTKQIWRGLVNYVNAPNLESNSKALKNLARTLFESMPWMARNPRGLIDYAKAASLESDRIALRNLAESAVISETMQSSIRNPFEFTYVPKMIVVQINPEALRKIDDAGQQARWSGFKTEKQLADQFLQQAVRYQLPVRRVLRWLSNRKRNAEDRPLAFDFLSDHMRHIQFERGDPAFGPEEEQSRYFTPGGDLKDDFPHRTLFYEDIADPICDFIQKEHELGRDAPVRICKRPGCGGLVFQSKKREFCRMPECDRERQKRDSDIDKWENRDRVYLHRLKKLKAGPRKSQVLKNADRLRDIVAYWRDRNPGIADNASDLLEKAGVSSDVPAPSHPAANSLKG